LNKSVSFLPIAPRPVHVILSFYTGDVLFLNVGTRFAVFLHVMNKNSQILRRPQKLSLGDLILAVSSCTKSSRETVATVADLLGSGRVRVEDHGRFLRAKVC
jgi:hypothetical protein